MFQRKDFSHSFSRKTVLAFTHQGRIYGKGRGGAHPPPPEMTCGFLIQLVLCQKKKTMWFIGVEVEQETSAPPLKKNRGSAPAHSTIVHQQTLTLRIPWQFLKTIFCLCWQHLLPACRRLLFTDVCTQATASKEFIPVTHEIKNDWKWDFPLAYQKFLGSLSMYRRSQHNVSFQVQTVTNWENLRNILCKETISWSTVFLCGIGYIHFTFAAQWFSKEASP